MAAAEREAPSGSSSDTERLRADSEYLPDVRTVLGHDAVLVRLAQIAADSRTVLMVTRQPKRLRRNLTASGIQATALRATDLPVLLGSRPYDAVIATSGLDSGHKARIAAMAAANNCRTTVDLCMVPTCDDGPAYHHLHHPDVIKTIEEANKGVAARASEAGAWIEARIFGHR